MGTTRISALANTHIDTVNGLSDVSAAVELQLWQKTDSIAVVNRKQEFIGILRHYLAQKTVGTKVLLLDH